MTRRIPRIATMTLLITLLSLIPSEISVAQVSPLEHSVSFVGSEKFTTSPPCTQKILWYTKGGQVCAPTTRRGAYKWQTIIKASDTTAFMKTCRSFFSTSEGQLLCYWMQKYVNNVIAIKGPKDTCLSYWKNLLNNAARVAQTTKRATVGTVIEPFAAKNSWVCHP